MTRVTCRLTAKNRDQLRNPTLGSRVWATFTITRSVSKQLIRRDSNLFFKPNLISQRARTSRVCDFARHCRVADDTTHPVARSDVRIIPGLPGCAVRTDKSTTFPLFFGGGGGGTFMSAPSVVVNSTPADSLIGRGSYIAR